MLRYFTLFLTSCILVNIHAPAYSAAKRPDAPWSYYYFDGRTFAEGQPADGKPYLAVRDGVRPQVSTDSSKSAPVKLTQGSGAIAGICYLQQSGGKLNRAAVYLPRPGVKVQITSGKDHIMTVETDEHGYFQAETAAGNYLIKGESQSLNVTVTAAKTTLVPLRIGKRMAD